MCGHPRARPDSGRIGRAVHRRASAEAAVRKRDLYCADIKPCSAAKRYHFAAGLRRRLTGNDRSAAGPHPDRHHPALCPSDRLAAAGRGERGGGDAKTAAEGGGDLNETAPKCFAKEVPTAVRDGKQSLGDLRGCMSVWSKLSFAAGNGTAVKPSLEPDDTRNAWHHAQGSSALRL